MSVFSDPISLCEKLIEYNTVSSNSNAVFLSFIEDLLKKLSFETYFHEIKGNGSTKKLNLIAYKNDIYGQKKGGLILSGHTDTVPFRSNQKAGLIPLKEGNLLYGRGSCDMKSGIAAQICAAFRYRDISFKKPLCLVFTADEEIGCLGAKALLETSYLMADYAIIGEPTSLQPIRTHKGFCALKVKFIGTACHSSNPTRGKNAILAAANAITSLGKIERELSENADYSYKELFHLPYTTMNIGTILGGSARNVVPESCEMLMEFRPIPNTNIDALFEKIEKTILFEATIKGVDVLFEHQTKDLPMETRENSNIVSILEKITNKKSGGISFSTEGKEFNQKGIETVILGPGSIDQAHQEDEYVLIEEIGKAEIIYSDAIKEICL